MCTVTLISTIKSLDFRRQKCVKVTNYVSFNVCVNELPRILERKENVLHFYVNKMKLNISY